MSLKEHDVSSRPVTTFRDRAPAIQLERGAAAEPELLRAVKLALGEGHRVVEAQRSERRGPDQANTDRRADGIAVVVHQSGTGARRGWVDRRRRTVGVLGGGQFAG